MAFQFRKMAVVAAAVLLLSSFGMVSTATVADAAGHGGHAGGHGGGGRGFGGGGFHGGGLRGGRRFHGGRGYGFGGGYGYGYRCGPIRRAAGLCRGYGYRGFY